MAARPRSRPRATWHSWQDLPSLKRSLLGTGNPAEPQEAGPSPAGETLDGALTTSFTLEPGEQRTVRFALCWHFPNATHGAGGWIHQGNMYTNWFNNALDVATYLRKNLDRLADLTRLYHDTFYRSNLPQWLLDRITSQTAVLTSGTCFWAADGYFGGFEGCRETSGCCAGNCSHVWHYAQSHARLFPSIARQMRESSYHHQTPDGNIPFRHQNPGVASRARAQAVAFDGQCGEILGSYREHLSSADPAWLDKHWPAINRAMRFVIATWDPDEDGLIAGQQHNTLDAATGGSSSWLGTLYLAALAASEKMATIQNDTDAAARYRRIRTVGADRQNETLFDGEYYIQRYDGSEGENYLTGCHMDQLLGQWWANQLDLGSLYPAQNVRTALASIFKYNFRTAFDGVGTSLSTVPRRFVLDDDHGTLMTTWPRGGRPHPPGALRFANEVWTGFEYSTAAAMIHAGLLPEALVMVRAAADRYDGRLRSELTNRAWGYSGNPFGDDECGKFYARAMSVWSLLLALQGFIYDGPLGRIGFKPKWKPEDHASFFTVAQGWGLYRQNRAADRQTHSIEMTYGRLRIREFLVELPDRGKIQDCALTLGEVPVPAEFSANDRELSVKPRQPIELEAGTTMSMRVIR